MKRSDFENEKIKAAKRSYQLKKLLFGQKLIKVSQNGGKRHFVRTMIMYVITFIRVHYLNKLHLALEFITFRVDILHLAV